MLFVLFLKMAPKLIFKNLKSGIPKLKSKSFRQAEIIYNKKSFLYKKKFPPIHLRSHGRKDCSYKKKNKKKKNINNTKKY